jgi:hypothetical protein
MGDIGAIRDFTSFIGNDIELDNVGLEVGEGVDVEVL